VGAVASDPPLDEVRACRSPPKGPEPRRLGGAGVPLGGVVDDVRQAVRLQVHLPGDGVDRHGGSEEPEFLSAHVVREVLDARLEVGVPGFGVVAGTVELP
jgi:hypothetical protein